MSKWFTLHPPKPSPMAPCKKTYSVTPVEMSSSDAAVAAVDTLADADVDALFKWPFVCTESTVVVTAL